MTDADKLYDKIVDFYNNIYPKFMTARQYYKLDKIIQEAFNNTEKE